MNGFVCMDPVHGDDWINCTLPPGQGAGNTILVIVGGQISDAKAMIGYGPCTAGKYAMDPLKGEGYGCGVCEAGKYTGFDNLPSCDQCISGRYQLEKGKSFCHKCEVGRFCPKNNQSKFGLLVNNCPHGFYQFKEEQIECLRCPV